MSAVHTRAPAGPVGRGTASLAALTQAVGPLQVMFAYWSGLAREFARDERGGTGVGLAGMAIANAEALGTALEHVRAECAARGSNSVRAA